MAIDYKSYDFQVYEYLVRVRQELQGALRCPRTEQWLRRIEEAEERIKTRRFRVAVVGEFKRGKSSFINALLGQNVLPVDVSPTTAIVSRITYGSTPRAYLYYKDGSKREVEIGRLAEYVTKLTEESKENAAMIQEAVIEYPSVFCQNYVDLIDTPGMNDDDAMNGRTISYLDRIDLAIVAVSANYPFSETECGFMVRLLESPEISQIVVVATYMDMVRKRDRERVLSFLKERIQETVSERLRKHYSEEDMIIRKYDRIFGGLHLYGVSCVEAMEAYESGNLALLESSGFVCLNNELPRLILSGQNNHALQKAMDTIESVIGEYRQAYPLMVKKGEDTAGRMREFGKYFAGECRKRAMGLAEEIRDRMCCRIDRFGEDMESKLSESFRRNFSEAGASDIGRLREAAGRCMAAYQQITEEARAQLDPDLQAIYEEGTQEGMCRFCVETAASLGGFAEYFGRQREAFLNLSDNWAAPKISEGVIPFGWVDTFLPGMRKNLKAENLAARAGKILAASLKYYCGVRKRDTAELCEKVYEKLYDDAGKIGEELLREAGRYEKQLSGAAGKAYSQQSMSRLIEIDNGNRNLRRQFLSELDRG